jgi:hypothetical protein
MNRELAPYISMLCMHETLGYYLPDTGRIYIKGYLYPIPDIGHILFLRILYDIPYHGQKSDIISYPISRLKKG